MILGGLDWLPIKEVSGSFEFVEICANTDVGHDLCVVDNAAGLRVDLEVVVVDGRRVGCFVVPCFKVVIVDKVDVCPGLCVVVLLAGKGLVTL